MRRFYKTTFASPLPAYVSIAHVIFSIAQITRVIVEAPQCVPMNFTHRGIVLVFILIFILIFILTFAVIIIDRVIILYVVVFVHPGQENLIPFRYP